MGIKGKEIRMKEFIIEADESTLFYMFKHYEPLTRCKECEHHGKRTNMCDIFHCHTNPNGYCHRGRIYGQTESGSESK